MTASDDTLPTPRDPDPDDPVAPAALVLTAAFEDPLDERRPWLERSEITDALEIPGAETPVYLTDSGIAVTTTGIGKSDAATTVTALLATPGIDLESAYVVSCGIAGSSPETAALGSVAVADAVVDWDRKHRWDHGEWDANGDDERGEATDERPIDLLAYRPRDYVHRLEDALVERALAAAREVDLLEDETAREYQRTYPAAPDSGPTIERGTTVCGDEFWHGPRYAREVAELCEAYGVGPYVTTQMEDAATARALERFDLRDRYLSVRAVSNYDRPAPGESVTESFDGDPASLALAIDNAARVGSAIVEDLIAADPLGIGAEGSA
ncbi:phosphorylase [Haloterrigena sp. SYSU A558-1]|uniref:Phosphorylase n=1 Tax=Haloterrigena gelatinilytica TaxID=2741724 RepID=A0A8J8GMF8_9EURY|nr:phosphorylase [Haloterrigena gelatinilytica]NUB90982.1 phosphorylase [Haloterrigena gelatinilytica]NUC73200.1 phosphorylase [Haloterrigena gelatinilytica]